MMTFCSRPGCETIALFEPVLDRLGSLIEELIKTGSSLKQTRNTKKKEARIASNERIMLSCSYLMLNTSNKRTKTEKKERERTPSKL